MLSIRDLVFKEQPVKTSRLLCKAEIANIVKLILTTKMRIYPEINISWVVRY